MSNMKLWGVAVGLIVLAGVSISLKKNQYGQATIDARVGQELVEKEVIFQADSIAIKKGAEALELKRDENDLWFIHGNTPFLAKADKVKDLFQELLNLKIQRKITDKKSQSSSLELDESKATKLLISGKGGSLSILKGKQRTKGQGIYMAFAGEEKAYVTDNNLRLLSNPQMWEQKNLFTWKKEDIGEVAIVTLNKQKMDLRFVKTEQNWTLQSGGQAGDTVLDKGVDELAENILKTTFTKKKSTAKELDKGDLLHHYQLKNQKEAVLDLQIFQHTKEDKKNYHFQVALSKPTSKQDEWLSKAGKLWAFEFAEYQFKNVNKELSVFLKAAESIENPQK